MAPSIAQMKCKDGAECSFQGREYPYEEYIADPTVPGSMQPVLKASYPKGSWSPASPKPGGTLFFAYPYRADPTGTDNPFSRKSAALEFEVYFPQDFDFVKGGKLPGMSGGPKGGRGCGGGVNPDECFSVRLMWRTGGVGEAYLYVPEGKQGADFCTKFPNCQGTKVYPCTECNYKAGVSFGRGSWQFRRGEWTRLRVALTLNDPDQANGILEVSVNGNTLITYTQLRWRQSADVVVEAMEMATWFGGGDASWGPPADTFALFRNFRAFRSGEPAGGVAAAGVEAASVLSSGNATSQVVSVEVIDVAPY